MSDRVVYLNGKKDQPESTDRVALQTMLDCLTIVSSKVSSEEVDGIIVITFNKDNTSEDYLVGQLNMAEVTHVLQCLVVNNVMMTQIDVRDMET